MSLRNLKSLSSCEFKNFLDSFDNVLCDCDGVVWRNYKPIPGAKATLSTLKGYGKQIRFLSNNSTNGVEKFRLALNSLEIDAEIDDLAIPTLAIIDYFKTIKYEKEILLLGTTDMKKEFSDAGFKLADDGPDRLEETLSALLKLELNNDNIGAVVVDFDDNLNYQKLLKAACNLKRPEVLFITGSTDKKVTPGLDTLLIGAGYIQNILENFTGRVPSCFGKSALNFNKYIIKKFNIQDPSRTLFVGDSLEQDMSFASSYGYQKLLILSGMTSLGDVVECKDKDLIPDFYINDLADLHELIKNKLNI